MSQFPGNGDALAPIYAAAVVVPDRSGGVAVWHTEILQEMSDGES